MTVYHIYNIVVESRHANLVHSEMYLSADDIGVYDINDALEKRELEEILSTTISHITGYPHYGFQYEIIKEECVNA